jgi:GlpG protein
MRQAGTLESPAAAQRLADYLLTLNIVSRVEPSDGRWALWIIDENQLQRAKEELQAFLQNPQDARYDAAGKAAADVRRQEAARVREARKNVVEMRGRWNRPSAGSGRLVLALTAISIFVAVFTRLGDTVGPELRQEKPPGLASLLLISTNVYAPLEEILREPYCGLIQIANGQFWRLITPIFLHFSIAHIIFNMMALLQLGSAVEQRQGTLRLAVIVLISAVISNLTQYFTAGPVFGGMSGVVYAVFGYIWMQSKFVPGSGLYMPPQMVFMCVFWFFLCMTGTVGPIANGAHAGGLITGALIGIAPLWLGKR